MRSVPGICDGVARPDRGLRSPGLSRIIGAPDGVSKVRLALIGDLPYREGQGEQFDTMIDEIDSDKIAFTVHVADIKGGSSLCDDAVYLGEYERFNTFEDPLVYTPGDNEWTDCHRAAGGRL